jgi:hypothetical protein
MQVSRYHKYLRDPERQRLLIQRLRLLIGLAITDLMKPQGGLFVVVALVLFLMPSAAMASLHEYHILK